MGSELVVTAYGHDKTIDKFSVTVFERDDSRSNSNAAAYCSTLNGLKLEGNSWVSAQIISANTQYYLDSFFPVNFDIILKLDDRSIQRVLREADSQEIARALKGENDALKDRIFSNMSKRAADMLKEDIEYMGPIPRSDARESQEKIINIIRILEETGEIVISFSKEETVK